MPDLISLIVLAIGIIIAVYVVKLVVEWLALPHPVPTLIYLLMGVIILYYWVLPIIRGMAPRG